MPEVMKQVRKDFGTDAVILQSRQIKSGGILGLFKKIISRLLPVMIQSR